MVGSSCCRAEWQMVASWYLAPLPGIVLLRGWNHSCRPHTRGLVAHCIQHAPARPAVNKWTKLGPCVDVLLFGVLCHNVLPLTFASLKVSAAQHQKTGNEDDVAYMVDLDFSALQGKRYAAALAMLSDKAATTALVVLALVLEALYILLYLSIYHMFV